MLKRWRPTCVLLGIHLSTVVHDDVVLGVPSISNDLLCLGNEAVPNGKIPLSDPLPAPRLFTERFAVRASMVSERDHNIYALDFSVDTPNNLIAMQVSV